MAVLLLGKQAHMNDSNLWTIQGVCVPQRKHYGNGKSGLRKKKKLRKHCGNGKRLERARILKNCHQGSLFNDSNNQLINGLLEQF